MFKRITSLIMITMMLVTAIVPQNVLTGFAAIVSTGTLRGTVNIPVEAPAGGVRVVVTYATEDVSTTVVIPQGAKSWPFAINGLTKPYGTLKYSLQDNDQFYCSNGFYKVGGSTWLESEASIVATNTDNIAMNIIPAKYTISGKLMFPGNRSWEYDECKATIVVINQAGTIQFSKQVVIKKNDASEEFAIGVPTIDKFSVGYVIDEPYNGKFTIYLDKGYYGTQGTVNNVAACTYVDVNHCDNIRFAVLEAERTISGEVDLPLTQEGIEETAPAGGLELLVVAQNSSQQSYQRMITIPEGKNFANFDLGVPADNGYSLKYVLQSQSEKYLLQGSYQGTIDVSGGSRNNTMLKIIKSQCLVYGKVSLPNGGINDTGDMSIDVHGISTMGDFYTTFILPGGQNSANYVLGLLVSQDKNFKISYEITQGSGDYYRRGYYNKGQTSELPQMQSILEIALDKVGVDLQLVKKPVIQAPIVSIDEIQDIYVQKGTSLEAIGLPKTVFAKLNNGTTKSFGVTWNNGTPTYTGANPGSYVMTGTLSMTTGVTNPANIPATVKVIVVAIEPTVTPSVVPTKAPEQQPAATKTDTSGATPGVGSLGGGSIGGGASTPGANQQTGKVEVQYIKNDKLPAAGGEVELLVLEAIVNQIENVKTFDEALKIAKDTLNDIAPDYQDQDSGSSQLYAKIAQKAVEKGSTMTIDAKVSNHRQKILLDEIKTKEIIDRIELISETAAALNAKLSAKKVRANINVVLNLQIGKVATNPDLEETSIRIPAAVFIAATRKIDRIQWNTGIAQITIDPEAINVTKAKILQLTSKKVDTQSLDKHLQEAIGKAPVYNFELTADGEKIQRFTRPVEVAIPYTLGKGENPEKITVFYITDSGTLQNVLGTYNPETKTVKFNTRHFSLYMIKYMEAVFKDIAQYTWAQDKIEVMASKGVISGTAAGSFAPGKNVTRAEFATMMTKALRLEDDNVTSDFDDVRKEHWFYATVSASFKSGIIKGRSQKIFDPDANISRQEMAIMISNALKLSKKTENVSEDFIKAFGDKDSVAPYAMDGVNRVLKYGLMKGLSTDSFGPNEKATRAQAAVVIYNLFNLK